MPKYFFLVSTLEFRVSVSKCNYQTRELFLAILNKENFIHVPLVTTISRLIKLMVQPRLILKQHHTIAADDLDLHNFLCKLEFSMRFQLCSMKNQLFRYVSLSSFYKLYFLSNVSFFVFISQRTKITK